MYKEFIEKLTVGNLKPIRTTQRAKELGRKGGLSKTPSKRLASRINGLKSCESSDIEKNRIMQLVKERSFVDVVTELISMNLEDVNVPARRDKIIEQLSKFIPSQVFSLEMNLSGSEKSLYEANKLAFEAIQEICPEKMEEINDYIRRHKSAESF